MKIELTNEQVVRLINSIDDSYLLEIILNQILEDDELWGDEIQSLAGDAEKASDAIYGIVDALDDLEEAYDRVASKTGLI